MRQKGFFEILILAGVMVTGISLFLIFNLTNKNKVRSVTPKYIPITADKINPTLSPTPSDNNTNILTTENKFVNNKYNYSIAYSKLFEIVTQNPKVSSQVNFRRKNDTVPATSGIGINVIESSSSLSSLCGSDFLENIGILCDKRTFRFNPVLDNDVPWERYEKDVVGIVPTGYIYASTYKDGNIFLIVNYGYKETDAYVFMINFQFVN